MKKKNSLKIMSSSSDPPPKQLTIWFILVDSENGEPYKGTSADALFLPPGSAIFQFRKAVKAEHPNKLASVDASQLLVYKNKSVFRKGKENPLRSSCLLDG